MPEHAIPSTLLVLRFLQNWPHPFAPSRQEIGAGVGLTHSATTRHIKILAGWGFLTYQPFASRSIRLTAEGKAYNVNHYLKGTDQ